MTADQRKRDALLQRFSRKCKEHGWRLQVPRMQELHRGHLNALPGLPPWG